MNQIIECVPNFSEGNDEKILNQIAQAIKSVEGAKLLHIDAGKATNRTVFTFVGNPDAVIEAAYQAIKTASELIDMRTHKGAHPRMGATDVCPLIPIQGITLEELIPYAHKLAKRVGEELHIPVYLYEYAASAEYRKNLATIREGEYEGFAKKMESPQWQPDYGTHTFNEKSGATVIGVRDFLVAYNINLNTKSTRIANSIAFDVREQGRVKRIGHPVLGELVLDELGNPERIPGTLKAVKAIGWFIEEYGVAQISMNLVDISVSATHTAFEEVCKKAEQRGVRVTGSEIVGLVPKKVLIDAGKYFLAKQNRSLGVSEEEIIHIAVKSLGLDELAPFNPKERVIEYLLEDAKSSRLVTMDLRAFANETASESPAPGGGSISAYVGSLGASLGVMVANLSAGKRGWEDKIKFFSDWAEQGQAIKDQLLFLVDEDTRAFEQVMNAFALPKNTEDEKQIRKKAIASANEYATRIPLKVMETAFKGYGLLESMINNGNPNSITDAAVGALCTHTAIEGAFLNVKINLSGLNNPSLKDELLTQATQIFTQSTTLKEQLLVTVNQKMGV